ncbi:MAG: zinc ribbon domain-containing protein [Acidobacteriota bacterium]
MPIFEYACLDCDEQFEWLVLGSSGDVPRCPSCESQKLEQQISVFSANTRNGAAASPPEPCGSCGDPRGPGSCSIN